MLYILKQIIRIIFYVIALYLNVLFYENNMDLLIRFIISYLMYMIIMTYYNPLDYTYL